jgi:hypothetical protein
MLHKLMPIALAATVTVIVASAALAAPAAGPPPGQVAAQICANLQQQLGTAFSAKYASVDDCTQQLTATAQALINDCQSKGQPETPAFKQCIQDGIAAAVQQVVGTGGGGTIVVPSTASVAGDICTDLQQQLGGAFTSRFGSTDQCRQTLLNAAASIISDCKSKADPGTDSFKQCIENGVAAAVAQQLGTGTTTPQATGASIAKQICASLQQKLGSKKFSAKYGSAAGCRSRLKATGNTVAAKCKSDTHCVQQAVAAALRKEAGK